MYLINYMPRTKSTNLSAQKSKKVKPTESTPVVDTTPEVSTTAAVVVDSAGSSTISVAPSAIAAVGGTADNGGLAAVDAAIALIDADRGAIGAAASRLTFAANNLGSQIENSSAAASRIRDTDFAEETSNLAKFQVLQQAGFSVLAQANAGSQSILSLLQ